MTEVLQSETQRLRRQLESLLAEARRNEEKMRRFDQLERRLIGADSLLELVRLLLVEYRQAFGVEGVRLALHDPDYEVSRLLDERVEPDPVLEDLQLQTSMAGIEALFAPTLLPRLEAFDARRHGELFAGHATALASVALLPLVRHGELIGCLYLGSGDPGRYVSGCGTDFLERLADIIAICLSNAMTQERLKRVGLTDGLTGVQNRRYFEHRLLEEISLARRHAHALACMFLDVDRFKRINDDYGHQAGDAVLRAVAEVIQDQLRVGDTIARYGGEEFVVLLPRASGRQAREIAERIRVAVAARKFLIPTGELAATISIGVAVLPEPAASTLPAEAGAHLVAAADRALYQAKQNGRNRVQWEDGRSGGAHPPVSGAAGTKNGTFWQRIAGMLAAGLSGILRRRPARA